MLEVVKLLEELAMTLHSAMAGINQVYELTAKGPASQNPQDIIAHLTPPYNESRISRARRPRSRSWLPAPMTASGHTWQVDSLGQGRCWR